TRASRDAEHSRIMPRLSLMNRGYYWPWEGERGHTLLRTTRMTTRRPTPLSSASAPRTPHRHRDHPKASAARGAPHAQRPRHDYVHGQQLCRHARRGRGRRLVARVRERINRPGERRERLRHPPEELL